MEVTAKKRLRRPKAEHRLKQQQLETVQTPTRKNRRTFRLYTVVVYERPRSKTVVLYVPQKDGTVFVYSFKLGASNAINGRVRKQWQVGRTKAYSMKVRAIEVAKYLLYDEMACRKEFFLDGLFREAAMQGLKVHYNDYFVQLWLSKPTGEPLGRIREMDTSKLGECIKCFSWSFGLLRIISPPWCCLC